MHFCTLCLVMLVYLAALWQLLAITVYTHCNRLLELSSLLSGSLLQRDSAYLECIYSVLFSVLYLSVCVLCVLFVFMLLPSGVINNNNKIRHVVMCIHSRKRNIFHSVTYDLDLLTGWGHDETAYQKCLGQCLFSSIVIVRTHRQIRTYCST